MRTKLQIIHRIKLLYSIFFIMIIASVVVGITGRDFQAGWKDGYKDALQNHEAEKSGDDSYTVTRFHYLNQDIKNSAFTIPVIGIKDNTLKINGRVNVFDFEVQSSGPLKLPLFPKVSSQILIILSALLYAAIFVVIFIILNSLRRSVHDNNIFSRHTITLTRCIGILMIVASILADVGLYIENQIAAQLLEGSQFVPYLGFPLTFRDLIMGVLILFIAEIFAIGYDMTEEQRLTI